jgi:hypothetical protein
MKTLRWTYDTKRYLIKRRKMNGTQGQKQEQCVDNSPFEGVCRFVADWNTAAVIVLF